MTYTTILHDQRFQWVANHGASASTSTCTASLRFYDTAKTGALMSTITSD
jgi:hypothetical protein